eukprot:scaffold9513_cov153-Skeletonema_marinoi.AAC.8
MAGSAGSHDELVHSADRYSLAIAGGGVLVLMQRSRSGVLIFTAYLLSDICTIRSQKEDPTSSNLPCKYNTAYPKSSPSKKIQDPHLSSQIKIR